ncbi:MAG: energy-coupling factor ABC transporter permease [Polyangiaceae bacterium]
MHIMEGYLPVAHSVMWTVATLPPCAVGMRALSRRMREHPESRLLLGACGGFVFVLSALKLPSVTGSCSHPTGLGLGSLLLGPSVMSIVGVVVLVFQALLLAHGGLTTLGANAFSMAIVGSYGAWAIHRLTTALRLPRNFSVFLAAALANVATYVVTALQLAWAFPDGSRGFGAAAVKFLGIFAITQIPIAVTEGLLTVLVMNLLGTQAIAPLRSHDAPPSEPLQ